MSTAKELFKELGYEKAEKSESVVLYTNGYGDTISFKETKHVVITPVQGCRSLTMTCLFENAIHKQCKELGWLEEEKPETNFERYRDDLLKVGSRFAFTSGKIQHCYDTNCSECAFACSGTCGLLKMKWLNQPYEKPTYKQTYKLTRFDYDLLIAHKDSGMQKCISNYQPLLELHEKGYFKDIDTNVPIHKILDNCEIKGEENYDEINY